MKKKILAWLLCAVMVLTIAPLPTALAADGDEPTTFVLSNEWGSDGEGGLIDALIAAGHGDDTMYEVMQLLQPLSSGAIPAEYMTALAACPADSEVKTVTLSNFYGLNNPVGVNADGTLMIMSIYGRDYYGDAGYTTTSDTLAGVGDMLFTAADSATYFIDTGFDNGLGGNYTAFAIAWSVEAPEATTFVLSNEEGGLIDELIAGGYGDGSMYDALVALEPASGGIISQSFLDTLSNCPAGSEIFTQPLNTYAGLTGAVAINTDGTVFTTTAIKGRNYHGETGYSTYPASSTARESFTYADSPAYYIDAPNGGTTHKVFAIGWSANEATTFVLSNEEGGLIDRLIAAGYGDYNLYEALIVLAPASNGVISDGFLDTLAACPAGSEIFTAKLSDYTGINNPVGINIDGTLVIVSIYGRDYYGQTGYSTYPEGSGGVGNELFTYATGPAYYINTGSSIDYGDGGFYHAFAIAWSGEAPEATTFVLSNEEGGLIDQLIADGYGNSNLYQALVSIAPASNEVISDAFLDTLALCDSGSEIFTVPLSSFAGDNNPVCVNTDGTLRINPIFGRDYYGDAGYSTYPEGSGGVGNELFTYANGSEYYIDAGELEESGGIYHAFAIAWSGEESSALTVAGTAADDTAILQIDNKTPSARDKTWELSVTTGTVAAGVSASDVTLTGLPAGLDYTAAKGTGNNIVITLTGAAEAALTADTTVTAVIKGSAVTEADAQDSACISLKLWYIGEATTFVISNESGGYLIDKLIAAGHGDDTLYEVMELLQPDFSSVITERFMQTLASNPADSDVFDDEAALINFAGLNNPICVNADGTLSINGIFGRDYHGNEGYTTTGSNMAGVGTVWATAADDSAHLIDAGSSGVIDGFTAYYKAFAILWMPELPAVTTDAVNTSGITQNSAAVSGSVTSAGTAAVTERGFVYGASANPTTSDTKVTAALGTGTGAFSATLTGLSASTAYHVRAYAISAAGTAYGADRTFTTLTGGGPGPEDNPPTVVTNTVTGIATTGATLNGNVTSDGGATVTARGFVYGLSANPAIGGAGVTQAASGNGTGAFTANISGLTAGATYHVRAYAINSEGTSYGADVPFTTLTGGGPGPGPEDNPPTVVTNAVTGITASGATLNGNVTASGGASVTARGFVYGAAANPAIGGAGVAQAASGSGTGTFTANISGLSANTTYHVRAYATNSEGTSYGADVPFATLTGGGEPDDPYIFRTLTDSATGITVSGVIHRDAALTVKNTVLHAAGTCAACDAIRARMTDSDFITLIDRDISLSLGFSGSLTITIPVGSAYNGETVTVLHCANGTLKTYTATVQDGKATFTVTSLSPFAVFADARELDNVPKTGDGGGFPLWLGLMASGVLLGSVLVLRRRPKRA